MVTLTPECIYHHGLLRGYVRVDYRITAIRPCTWLRHCRGPSIRCPGSSLLRVCHYHDARKKIERQRDREKTETIETDAVMPKKKKKRNVFAKTRPVIQIQRSTAAGTGTKAGAKESQTVMTYGLEPLREPSTTTSRLTRGGLPLLVA